MLKKILITISGLLILAVGFVLWAKVPSPTAENTVIQEGKVIAVGSPCCNDIVFYLEGDNHVYYINHGLDFNLPYLAWNEELKGKQIKVEWIETHWNPFNAKGTHRPISKVIFEEEELYDMSSLNSMAALE